MLIWDVWRKCSVRVTRDVHHITIFVHHMTWFIDNHVIIYILLASFMWLTEEDLQSPPRWLQSQLCCLNNVSWSQREHGETLYNQRLFLGFLNLSFRITVAFVQSLSLLEILNKTDKQKARVSGAENTSCKHLDRGYLNTVGSDEQKLRKKSF